MQSQALHGGRALPAGRCQPAVIGMAPFERAVDEHGDNAIGCFHGFDDHRPVDCPGRFPTADGAYRQEAGATGLNQLVRAGPRAAAPGHWDQPWRFIQAFGLYPAQLRSGRLNEVARVAPICPSASRN